MNNIIVAPSENGKYKVLYNYIQHGIEYSTEVQANKEANTLKEKIFGKLQKP